MGRVPERLGLDLIPWDSGDTRLIGFRVPPDSDSGFRGHRIPRKWVWCPPNLTPSSALGAAGVEDDHPHIVLEHPEQLGQRLGGDGFGGAGGGEQDDLTRGVTMAAEVDDVGRRRMRRPERSSRRTAQWEANSKRSRCSAPGILAQLPQYGAGNRLKIRVPSIFQSLFGWFRPQVFTGRMISIGTPSASYITRWSGSAVARPVSASGIFGPMRATTRVVLARDHRANILPFVVVPCR